LLYDRVGRKIRHRQGRDFAHLQTYLQELDPCDTQTITFHLGHHYVLQAQAENDVRLLRNFHVLARRRTLPHNCVCGKLAVNPVGDFKLQATRDEKRLRISRRLTRQIGHIDFATLNREAHGHHCAQERSRSQNEHEQAHSHEPFESLAESHDGTVFNLACTGMSFQSAAPEESPHRGLREEEEILQSMMANFLGKCTGLFFIAGLYFVSRVPLEVRVLDVFGRDFNCRREESVGSVHRSIRPEKTVSVNEAFWGYTLPQNPMERVAWCDDIKLTLRSAKRLVHDKLVFFRLERACGVNQSSLWREIRECTLEQPHLARMQVGKILGAKLPANFRVPRECPGAGAWRVYQNAVEPALERQGIRSIEYDGVHILNACGPESLRHFPNSMRMQVRRDHVSLEPGCACQENRFSTRRGAKIQNRISTLDRQ